MGTFLKFYKVYFLTWPLIFTQIISRTSDQGDLVWKRMRQGESRDDRGFASVARPPLLFAFSVWAADICATVAFKGSWCFLWICWGQVDHGQSVSIDEQPSQSKRRKWMMTEVSSNIPLHSGIAQRASRPLCHVCLDLCYLCSEVYSRVLINQFPRSIWVCKTDNDKLLRFLPF